MTGRKRGRPRALDPKVTVSFRVPTSVANIYDDAERQGGMKANKAMERVVTLHAQTIFRKQQIARPANQATLSRDGRHPIHH